MTHIGHKTNVYGRHGRLRWEAKKRIPFTRHLASEPLERRELLAGDTLVISEFMASNDGTTVDQYGLSSDWIEIFNPSDAPVSLAGWHLTDDPQAKDKWTFPTLTLNPSSFLVVFASGQSQMDPAQPLHTNFRLGADGEYLGLIRPDMTVAHAFGEAFPPQFADVSFGLGARSAQLVPDNTSLTYHVPTASESALATSAGWTLPSFNDSAWSKSNNTSITKGIGYAISTSAADFAGQFAVNVESDIFLKTGSLWIRQDFEVANPSDVDGLLLDIQYDDGFVAYLNGVKVKEVNTPVGDLSWNSEAEVPRRPRRTNANALTPERFDIGQYTGSLVPGTNVLAILALNDTSFDEELLSRASMTSITIPSDPAQAVVGYLSVATPGTANRQLRGGAITFSQDSKVFTEPFDLQITPLVAGETIRFTTDGTNPSTSSQEYTGPIRITESDTIRAAAFAADGSIGPVIVRSFVKLGTDLGEFSTNLPLVVFSTPITRVTTAMVPESNMINSYMTVFEPDAAGRTKITTEPVLSTPAGIQRRGSSTAGNTKINMAVETRDDAGSDSAVPLLGMPSDADWIFYAPYNFDRAKGPRDTFFYEISNQIGQWAPRTRFVEVFHNVDGSDLGMDDYQGIYVIIEKIKRGENRVNIKKLAPTDITEPNITGGWIWKIDRNDPADPTEGTPADSGVGVSLPGGAGAGSGPATLLYVNPKEVEVEAVPEQVAWAKAYLNNITAVLRNRDSTWGQITDLIDVDSWIENSIVNVLTLNLDAYRLSGYIYKDRGGKLVQGPLWDCDRCMGSEDGRDRDPYVWHSRVPDYGTDFTGFPWWRDLFTNQPNFWQAWIDRWFELRKEVLSDANMDSIVDALASQLVEAHQRDTDKWRQTPNGGQFAPPDMRNWEGEVIHLKGWLRERARWLDERFVQQVTMTPAGGQLAPGQQLTMSAAAGTIYYTTDGTDPRASGGARAANAIAYTGPITVGSPMTIIARAFDDSEPVVLNPNRTHTDPRSGSFWSAPTTVHFAAENFASASNLRITEVNYRPSAATQQELNKIGQTEVPNDEFEFIELMNISDQPISLEGVELVRVLVMDANQGVNFKFEAQTLNPGERIVVVENVPAFRARYGDSVRIAKGNDSTPDGAQGQYGGLLENRGENLRLVNKFGDLIQRFAYDDSAGWPERADGAGSSLELIDVRGDYGNPANWRASTFFGGSPGTDGRAQENSVVVTEVLINTDPPKSDRVELHNTTSAPIDITHWYVSDSPDNFAKFQVTTPTTIPAGGYAVLTEQQLGFGFDGARGGQIFLIEADSSGRPIRFVSETEFGNSGLNISLGRWPDANGQFYPMAQSTFGRANSGIRPGDVVISEVHYSPIDPDGAGRQTPEEFEFVELYNQTNSAIDLGGWRLSGPDVEFTFAQGTTIGAREAVAVVRFDPTTGSQSTVFRFFFNAAPSVRLFGDFRKVTRGSLNNEGSSLLLERPGTPSEVDPSFTSMVWVDQLAYTNQVPWPTDVNANGNSLTRVSAQQPGFLPTNWSARPAAPGSAEFAAVRVPGDSNEDGQFNQLDIVRVLQAGKYGTGQPASWSEGDWNGDGVFNQLDIVLALQAGTYTGGAQAVLAPSARDGRFTERGDVAPEPADAVFAKLDDQNDLPTLRFV